MSCLIERREAGAPSATKSYGFIVCLLGRRRANICVTVKAQHAVRVRVFDHLQLGPPTMPKRSVSRQRLMRVFALCHK